MTYVLRCPRCHRTDGLYLTNKEDTGGKIYRCSRCYFEGHPNAVYIPTLIPFKRGRSSTTQKEF